jgi:glycosyltransferase involved in cell wall biosynthesis
MLRQSGDLSGNRRTALLMTPEAPYPMMGGGPMRTASVLEYLAQKYTVDVIVFREPGAPDPRTAFPADLVRNVTVIDLPYHSNTQAARVTRNAKRLVRGVPPLVDRFSGFDVSVQDAVKGHEYKVAVVEHFWCANYFEVLEACCETLVLDLHNIESVLLARCADTENWFGRNALSRFSRVCADMERRVIPHFSMVLVTSEADRAQLQHISPDSKFVVYPNAVPLVKEPKAARRDEIVFSGNLEYHPNRSAIEWFAADVWPEVRRRFPHVNWRLVGRKHESAAERFAGDARIEVAGPVQDAVAEIGRAKVAIAPILAGSGTRFKILEAWAAGTPVVSTKLGAEGLPGVDGEHFLMADDAAAFAGMVGKLLESSELRDRIAVNARALYEAQFTWEAGWRLLERAGL